jgi:hypothetical protein
MNEMIIDLRVYTYLPSKFRKFLKGYEEQGFALTSRHLGQTLGIFTSESGTQNRTFQFFMYEDSTHRNHCRAGMRSDPAWGEFVKIDGDALLQQHNTVLVPLPGVELKTPPAPTQGRASDKASRLFELQTLNCTPSSYPSLIRHFKESGIPLLRRHDIEVIGAFGMDTGNDDSLMILSVYDDDATRDAHRQRLQSDPEFQDYQRTLLQLLSSRETTLLLATSYSPLQ